jgi:serine/threonine protein kinase
MTGRTIGNYEMLDKLGEGGMGVVWKARDTRLDRLVAIKMLPADKAAGPERKRRFVLEAKAASALNHPNINHDSRHLVRRRNGLHCDGVRARQAA